jgi:hypothetical protein
MAFNPTAPDASHVVTITIGERSDIPIPSPVVTVQGATIRVAVTIHGDVGCGQSSCSPPIVCATTIVGPLLQGTYATRLDVTNTLRGTFSVFGMLIVSPFVAVVPTTSATGVAALVLILFTGALWTLRRELRMTSCRQDKLKYEAAFFSTGVVNEMRRKDPAPVHVFYLASAIAARRLPNTLGVRTTHAGTTISGAMTPDDSVITRRRFRLRVACGTLAAAAAAWGKRPRLSAALGWLRPVIAQILSRSKKKPLH